MKPQKTHKNVSHVDSHTLQAHPWQVSEKISVLIVIMNATQGKTTNTSNRAKHKKFPNKH